jgi:5-methylcytosine-specific restriction endonuclease McrA
MSRKNNLKRKRWNSYSKRATARRKRLWMYIKQLGRCIRCHQFMYIPTRWYADTDRMATFEHVIDLEYLTDAEARDFNNIVLMCRKCNGLKCTAKQVGSPFKDLFNYETN